MNSVYSVAKVVVFVGYHVGKIVVKIIGGICHVSGVDKAVVRVAEPVVNDLLAHYELFSVYAKAFLGKLDTSISAFKQFDEFHKSMSGGEVAIVATMMLAYVSYSAISLPAHATIAFFSAPKVQCVW